MLPHLDLGSAVILARKSESWTFYSCTALTDEPLCIIIFKAEKKAVQQEQIKKVWSGSEHGSSTFCSAKIPLMWTNNAAKTDRKWKLFCESGRLIWAFNPPCDNDKQRGCTRRVTRITSFRPQRFAVEFQNASVLCEVILSDLLTRALSLITVYLLCDTIVSWTHLKQLSPIPKYHRSVWSGRPTDMRAQSAQTYV